MRYTYCVQESVVQSETGETYTAYGVAAVDTQGAVLRSFSDVFFDKNRAEHFVNVCNEEALSLEHFSDAVQDAVIAQ